MGKRIERIKDRLRRAASHQPKSKTPSVVIHENEDAALSDMDIMFPRVSSAQATVGTLTDNAISISQDDLRLSDEDQIDKEPLPPSKPMLSAQSAPVLERKVSAPSISNESVMTARFKKTLTSKFMKFKQDADLFAAGDAGFSNSLSDWFANGFISSTTILLNTGVAIIAGLGILMSPITTGLALGISLTGVLVGIGYNIYTSRRDRNRYKHASKFMERDDIERDVERIAEALSIVLHDQLKDAKKADSDMLAKAANQIISYAILHGKVTNFEDLFSPAKLTTLLGAYAHKAPEFKLQTKSTASNTTNTRMIMKQLAKNHVVNEQKKEKEHADFAAPKKQSYLSTLLSPFSWFWPKKAAAQEKQPLLQQEQSSRSSMRL